MTSSEAAAGGVLGLICIAQTASWQAQLEPRLIYGVLSMFAAGLALTVDQPKSRSDCFCRCFAGFGVGFFFAEPAACHLGLADSPTGMFTAAGGLGIVSWYGLELVVGMCRKAQQSEFVQKLLLNRVIGSSGGHQPPSEDKKP